MPQLEHEEPKNSLITLYLVISAFFMFVIILVVYIYFNGYTQQENYVKIDLAPTDDLLTLRHRETELLGQDVDGKPKNTYEVVDATKGIYRIPIDRAIQLEAQSPWRGPAAPVAGAQTLPANASHATPTSTSR